MGITSNQRPEPVRYSSANPVPTHWAALPCIDVVNTRWTHHLGSGQVFDRLGRPGWLPAFQEHWSLEVKGEVDRQRLRALRGILDRVLRAVAGGGAPDGEDIGSLNAILAQAPLLRRIEPAGAGSWILTASRVRDEAWMLAEIVASAGSLLAQGSPGRLKTCQNQHCSWVFQDESRNRSRRWCDEAVCGNLVKVRRFRATGKAPR